MITHNISCTYSYNIRRENSEIINSEDVKVLRFTEDEMVPVFNVVTGRREKVPVRDMNFLHHRIIFEDHKMVITFIQSVDTGKAGENNENVTKND